MAKNDKKAQEAAAAAANNNGGQNPTVENNETDVVEEIKSQNLMRAENVTKALEKIQKDKDEQQQRELIDAIQQTEYTNKKKRLDLRKRRAEEKITKESLTKSKQILDDLCAGKLTKVEAEEATKTAKNEEYEAFKAINKEFDKHYRELRTLYPGYWRYDWDERW